MSPTYIGFLALTFLVVLVGAMLSFDINSAKHEILDELRKRDL